MSEYVYYVSYGSNILFDRFRLYIEGGTNEQLGISQDGCRDNTLPKEIIPYIINHSIYFANTSTKWDNQGVAFLDMSKPGFALGRAYLITKEQFEDVHSQEGNHPKWYNQAYLLGYYNNLEVWTISNSSLLPQTATSGKYLNVIISGLCETYPKDNTRDDYINHLKKSLQQ